MKAGSDPGLGDERGAQINSGDMESTLREGDGMAAIPAWAIQNRRSISQVQETLDHFTFPAGSGIQRQLNINEVALAGAITPTIDGWEERVGPAAVPPIGVNCENRFNVGRRVQFCDL